MSWDNKIVWTEGMFLQPQHFQQQERYFERLLRDRVKSFRPYGWGITELQIDYDLLSVGKFAVARCRGVFEDGTPFAIPEDSDHPAPLDVPENARDTLVYLAIPVRHPGAAEVSMGLNGESVARFQSQEFEVSDAIEGADSTSTVQIGKLRSRYMTGADSREGFIGLALARIVEMRADKHVVLDDSFIPPCLVCAASQVLTGYFAELHGLLHHRGEALAARVSQSGTHGAAEIADFLMLQVVNRQEPLFAHFGATDSIHPERLYSAALQLAGELSTFTSASKRPIEYPVYRHDDLEHSFGPVIADLRQSLSAVLEQTAIPIPLQDRKYGIRVAQVADRSLLGAANFVLAVHAATSAEVLRRHLPNQIKIGPVESIRELVNSALPGIQLVPLPVAPRQIPYHAGATYFELDRSGRMWKQLQQSGGIAFHLAGDFPDMQMELWAIRGR